MENEFKQASEADLKRIVDEGKQYNPMLTPEQIEAYKMGYRSGIDFAGKWFDEHTDERIDKVLKLDNEYTNKLIREHDNYEESARNKFIKQHWNDGKQ